jgi:HAD superfamily hydrolase (TIGR01458 family)
MAAILLDIEGVLQVSWEIVPGAVEAVERLREAGHRLRFVTNNTTRARRDLAFELQRLGIDLEEEELQTTPIAAASALAGRRVLALTMPRIIDDLKGIELVGENADAVLIGGADESPATNQVFSYMNLARAFAELESGAELYCLHRNRWWETARGPLLDTGAFVAGLEYAAEIEATLLGKPSAAYFRAALEALDADAERSWMVGDDLEADIDGAQKCGLKAVLVRTGKFRQEELDGSAVHTDGVLDSIAELPDWLERREDWG